MRYRCDGFLDDPIQVQCDTRYKASLNGLLSSSTVKRFRCKSLQLARKSGTGHRAREIRLGRRVHSSELKFRCKRYHMAGVLESCPTSQCIQQHGSGPPWVLDVTHLYKPELQYLAAQVRRGPPSRRFTEPPRSRAKLSLRSLSSASKRSL